MRSDARTPQSVRIAAQRDIDAGKLSTREIAGKHGISRASVEGWKYNRTPLWVTEAMRVRVVPRPHVMPWVTDAMLTAGRARASRIEPEVIEL